MWCGVVPGWAPLPLIAEIFSFPFPDRLGFIFESWSWGAVRRPYLVFLGRGLCPGFWLWVRFVSGAVALGAVCVRGRGFGHGLCPGSWLWARFVSGFDFGRGWRPGRL